MGIFAFFLTSKLGRGIGIGILALALAGGIYWRGHSSGVQDGKVSGAKETFDTLKADMDAERAKTRDRLAQLDQQIAGKDAIITQQQTIVQQSQAAFASLQIQQATIQKQISALTDSQVTLDLATRLKVRPASDLTPTLYPSEIRRADEIVGDYGIVTQKVDNLQSQIVAQGTQIKALEDKQALTEHKFGVAMDYIDQSDKRFVNAYNVFEATVGRPAWQRILTLGLLHNKKIQKLTPITAPVRPAELK